MRLERDKKERQKKKEQANTEKQQQQKKKHIAGLSSCLILGHFYRRSEFGEQLSAVHVSGSLLFTSKVLDNFVPAEPTVYVVSPASATAGVPLTIFFSVFFF